uniref:Carboxylic ester hydrolase n=1 Tax=Panagrolaimus sp. JU765 TaxID=591449 RepID=A0AC34PXE9_9BILA
MTAFKRKVSAKLTRMGSTISAKKAAIYPHPEADTQYGRVQGRHFLLPNGRSTSVYLGIPFAKPPKPQPPDPWPDVLSAAKYKSRSIQKDFIWDAIELQVGKSEDCLYLNVMAPNWAPPEGQCGFPVMFYIHGGGFVMDSAVKYHYTKICRNLVSMGVVVVTIQYRLGFLGYFSTDDDVCVGNNGLWDQFMALKFVKENIQNFGGDPNNITLFGQSAGGVSCDLLSLSPYSRDLFDKMVLMAGNAETIWSVSPRCRVARNCRAKALKLGFKKPSPGEKWSKTDHEELMRFMLTVPAEKLGLTMIGMTEIFESMQLPVTPVIDGDFLPKSLAELRKEAPKKLVIAGNCQYEGLLFLALGMKHVDRKLIKFVKLRASTLIMEGNALLPKNEQMTFKAWEALYGLNKTATVDKKDLKRKIVTLIGDMVNGVPHFVLCNRLRENGSTVYSYNFHHFNNQALQTLSFYLPFNGATHCSEINSIFDINMFVGPYVRTDRDRQVTKQVCSMLTNFARTGNPNGPSTSFEWLPINNIFPTRHLVITSEPQMKEKQDHSRFEKQAQHFTVIHDMMTLIGEDDYTDFSITVKDFR